MPLNYMLPTQQMMHDVMRHRPEVQVQRYMDHTAGMGVVDRTTPIWEDQQRRNSFAVGEREKSLFVVPFPTESLLAPAKKDWEI